MGYAYEVKTPVTYSGELAIPVYPDEATLFAVTPVTSSAIAMVAGVTYGWNGTAWVKGSGTGGSYIAGSADL